jgi:hypothetical protein
MKESARDQITSIIVRTQAIASVISHYFSLDSAEKDITLKDDTIAALSWQMEENLAQIDTLLPQI